MKRAAPLALVLSVGLLAGCASDPRPVHERGWVGGDLLAVRDGNDWLGPWSPDVAYEPVVGMPEGVGRAGLLVREAHADTPLGRAGLRAGDLVLDVDGDLPGTALHLHESMDERAPGEHVSVRYWREGAERTADVTVGRERYERLGTLSIGLGFPFWTATLDVWPFDDGIDILGLVVAKHHPERRQAVNVRGEYLRAVRPDAAQILPPQEQTVFRVFPVSVGRSVRILEQTTD